MIDTNKFLAGGDLETLDAYLIRPRGDEMNLAAVARARNSRSAAAVPLGKLAVYPNREQLAIPSRGME